MKIIFLNKKNKYLTYRITVIEFLNCYNETSLVKI